MAQLNYQRIEEIEIKILKYLEEDKSTEKIVSYLLYSYGLEINNATLYYLYNTTILAFLQYLRENKKIEFKIKNNIPYWHNLI
ncbi:hypothetical protein [Marinitoga lauensis]|uniref:hypothetical protein n=1 Tax=Marinitoga lauensis TaxID=2201189 RepID=UPI0010111208|nr:hypothetical protein [Marinitoga lauensis]